MKILLFLVVLVCFAKSGFAQGRDNFVSKTIGEYEYFYNAANPPVLKTALDAADYCKSQSSCLAVVVPTTFNSLVRWLPENSEFWVDGKLALPAGVVNLPCSSSSLDLGQLPPEQVDISATTCLFIDRGIDTPASKISARDCGTNAIPLCSIKVSLRTDNM